MAARGDPRLAGSIAFRYPDFTVYEVARFLIVAALEMQSVAVGWQVYEITKRPLDLGLVGLAQFLPGIFLFLVAGHAADRYDTRVLILGSISLTLFAVLLGGAVALFPSMPRKFWIPGLGGWEFFAVLRLRVLRPWQFSLRISLWGAGRDRRCFGAWPDSAWPPYFSDFPEAWCFPCSRSFS